MVNGHVIDFARNVSLSNHTVLFYETPKEKYDILFPFIKAGLENQQAAIYLSDDESPENILSRLSRIGIKEETKGLQVLDGEEFYFEDGTFKKNTVIDKWMKAVHDAISKGHKGLRVTGEPTLFFKSRGVFDGL